jgi:protein-S-isoprenylcysteine O-methyltransferase Ste14
MNPRHRFAIFIGIVLVLMAPYVGFVVYYSQQFPSSQWPAWFTDVIGVWFVANFIVLMLLFRRMFRGQRQVVEPRKARVAVVIMQIFVSYLLVVWSVFFLYELRETLKGNMPLNRAIPAGAFLLFFIGLFGWSLYRTTHRKA